MTVQKINFIHLFGLSSLTMKSYWFRQSRILVHFKFSGVHVTRRGSHFGGKPLSVMTVLIHRLLGLTLRLSGALGYAFKLAKFSTLVKISNKNKGKKYF